MKTHFMNLCDFTEFLDFATECHTQKRDLLHRYMLFTKPSACICLLVKTLNVSITLMGSFSLDLSGPPVLDRATATNEALLKVIDG